MRNIKGCLRKRPLFFMYQAAVILLSFSCVALLYTLFNYGQTTMIKKNILIIFILISNNIFAHNYYFSSNYKGEQKGTITNPFASTKELYNIKFFAGDSILLNGDEIFFENILLENIHAVAENPVVFTSYGNKKAIVNGKFAEAFILKNSSGTKISNLIFIGAGRKTGNIADGIKLVDCKNISLENLDVSGFQKSGVILFNTKNATVSNVDAHDNGFSGILVEGDYQQRISSNIHIIDCKANNNPGDPTNLENHSGNGILVGNCKNVLIEYCTATNNGWDMPRIGNGPVGIWAYEADSVTIQYCISYKNKTAVGAADGGGFDLDGGVTNSVIQYCLSYDNWGSGYGIYQYNSASKWSNNTVRFCISINDGNITDKASAMLIWNGFSGDTTFTNFYAYNNVFYNDKKYAFAFHPDGAHKNFYFFNNVFIAADSANIFMNLDSSKSDIFLGNIWMKKNGGFSQDGYTNIKNWCTVTNIEIYHGKQYASTFNKPIFLISDAIEITHPHLLANNTVLKHLCIDALKNKGIDVKKSFGINAGTKDFFGHTLPGKSNTPGVCISQ